MTTQAEKDEIVARAAKIASIGGGLLSNASLLKKAAEALEVEPPPPVGPRCLPGLSFGSNTDPGPVEQLAGCPTSVWRLYYQANEVPQALAAIDTAGRTGRRVLWLSFKLPLSWAAMGQGQGDAWVQDTVQKLHNAATTAGVEVWICYHHEPEDNGSLSDWLAMQRHILPMSKTDRIKRTTIATGYPQIDGGAYANWTIEAMYPGDGLVEILGVDPYLTNGMYPEKYGVGTPISSWNLPSVKYMPAWASFAKQRGIDWAVAETGITDPAFQTSQPGRDGPGFFMHEYLAAQELDAVAWCYFDSPLNSRGTWLTDNIPAKRAALASVLAQAA